MGSSAEPSTRTCGIQRQCRNATSGKSNTTDAELRGVAERLQQVAISEQMVNTPYDMQESLHPHYFGQMALRSCLRQAFNDGYPRSGACRALSDWAATTLGEEPAVTFTAVRQQLVEVSDCCPDPPHNCG